MNQRRKAVFLSHVVDAQQLPLFDPVLGHVGEDERTDLLLIAPEAMEPFFYHFQCIRSGLGAEVDAAFLGLPADTAFFAADLRSGHVNALGLTDRAFRMALAAGADTVGLGQFTSIVSGSGLFFRDEPALVTSGNALTTACAWQSLLRVCRDHGVSPAHARVGVVGALGNIGSALAELLCRDFRAVRLVGRPAAFAEERLRGKAKALATAGPATLEVAVDRRALFDCDAVVIATNAARAHLDASHFRPHAVVIDVSVPINLSPGLRGHADLHAYTGGYARLPESQDLHLPLLNAPAGETYACVAETLLLGLEGRPAARHVGPLRVEDVDAVLALAVKHGFGVGSAKPFVEEVRW